MLRINLLPGYVTQRRLTRKLVFGFTTLFVLCLAIPFLLYVQANNSKTEWDQKATAAEAGKAKTDSLKSQASSTRSKIAPIQEKVDFVKAVHQHNEDIAKFWDTVARYSSGSKVIYTDAAVSGTTLTIKAYTPSIAEVGRYLQAMYQEPDFSSVGIDKLPGYPEAVVKKYYLGNQLIAIGTSSGSSGGGAQFGGGGGPQFGGGGGQFGGGQGGGKAGITYGQPAPLGPAGFKNVPVIGTGGQQGPGGGAGGAAGASSDVQKLYQALNTSKTGRVAAPAAGNFNPFLPPQANVSGLLQALKRVRVRQEPQGFPVTVTATLKQPLVVPSVPGGAAPTTAGGSFGPPGGFPGGPPGGFPGGPPGGFPGGAPPGAVRGR